MIPYDFYYQAVFNNFLKDVDVKCLYINFGNTHDFEFLVSGNLDSKNCIVFYDQEPFDRYVFLDKLRINKHFRDASKRIVITSEESPELEQAASELDFVTFDYFYHGLLCIEWYRHCWFNNIKPTDDFDRLYITYNNLMTSKRLYRTNLLIELQKQGLLDRGYASFNTPSIQAITSSVSAYSYLLPLSHKTNIVENTQLLDKKYVLDSESVNGNYSAKIDTHAMQKAFLNLVTETIFYENKVHLTEKTFKPIVSKMPFLLLAGPGNLNYLADYGFQTFGDYWNESYDNISNPVSRFDAVMTILNDLAKLPTTELKKMHNDMRPILEHNFNHFFKELKPIIASEFTYKLGKILKDNSIQFNPNDLVKLNNTISY